MHLSRFLSFTFQNSSVFLVFAAFLCLPIGRAVELPTFIMAVFGLLIAWRRKGYLFADPSQRLFGLLFLCVWLPMLLSVVDAVNMNKASSSSLVFLRFYFVGIFVIATLANVRRQGLILHLGAALIAFWVLDALIQAVVGEDLFGFRYSPSRLNGIYGEHHLDLGVALPTMASLLLVALRHNPWLLTFSIIITGIVVMLAGSRGGWISYALVCLLLLVNEIRLLRLNWVQGAFLVALLAGVLAGFSNFLPDFRERLNVTYGLFSGDIDLIDQASSGRLQIWDTALNISRDHLVTGVGVGGFRYVYPNYAKPGDTFVDETNSTGPFYAHQLLIQIGTETGLVGLTGLILFYGFWWRSWRCAHPQQKQAALPYALGILAWVFPFNAHASFYSSQWSQLIWLLMSLYCATIIKPRSMADEKSPISA